MTLDQMRYFLAAAKFQNITKAGQTAHISPSAVSAAIAKLEEELGCLLFRREGKFIFLSEEGRTFQLEILRIFDEMESIKSKVAGSSLKMSGEYRLAGSPYLSSRQLTLAWTVLLKNHPKLKGELVGMHTALVLNELYRGTVDFGLCFSPQSHPDLYKKILYEGQLRIAVRKNHPILKLKGKEQIKKLTHYPAVIHKASPGVELCKNHPVFAQFHIEPDVRLQFDGNDQALNSLIHSDFWSLMPDICVSEFENQVELLPKPQGWNAPYHIASVVSLHRRANPVLLSLEQEIQKLILEIRIT